MESSHPGRRDRRRRQGRRSRRPRSIRPAALALALLIPTLVIATAAAASKGKWPSPVVKAFKTITAKECYAHVAVLASDDYEGRASGKRGGRLASTYIAREFAAMGLEPGGIGGTWFQPFSIPRGKIREGPLAEMNHLVLGRKEGDRRARELEFGTDFLPHPISGEGEVKGACVFLGGLLAGAPGAASGKIEVSDKVVLLWDEEALETMVAGEPPVAARLLAARLESLREDGAVAALLVPLEKSPPPLDPESWPPEEPEPEKPSAGKREGKDENGEKDEKDPDGKKGGAPGPEEGEGAGGEGEKGDNEEGSGEPPPALEPEEEEEPPLPVVRLSAEAADKLLSKAGKSRASLARKARDGKLAPFALRRSHASLKVARKGFRYGRGRNVIGVHRGSDPKLRDEYVVVGAHYDHVGLAKGGRSSRGTPGKVHNGADDNASGTTGLIEVAEAFCSRKVQVKRSIVFIAFDAEELGLVGSTHYVGAPTRPIDKTVAMLNMDMISRNKPREMYMAKVEEFAGLNRIVDGVAGRFGIYLDPKGMDRYLARSDQGPFIEKGIPAVFIYGGGHPQYHTEHDDLELIDPMKIESIARLMFLFTYECANHTGSFVE